MKLLRLIFALSFILLTSPRIASAEPMFITFKDLMKQSRLIVVARYLGPVSAEKPSTHRLEVEEVLFGQTNEKTLTVPQAYGNPKHEVPINSRCIAFIDQQNRFQWAAVPITEKDIDGPLHLKGFYDLNAYLVDLPLITIKSLKTYLKTQKMDYQFSGFLYLFSKNDGRLRPTSIKLRASWSYGKRALSFSGLPGINPALPPTYIRLGEGQIFIEQSWTPGKSIRLTGKIVDFIDATDTFQVEFWPIQPSPMTETEFKEYLQDPKVGALLRN